MEIEDLVIEFHKKMALVENKFFENIDSRRKAQDELWNQFHIENHGELAHNNTNPETISIPLNYDFHIKGHRCRIAQRLEIEVLD